MTQQLALVAHVTCEMTLYFRADFTNIAVHKRPIKQAFLNWHSWTVCA